jgi:hypothetical protein
LDEEKSMTTLIKYRRDLWQLIKNIPGDAAEIGVAEGNFSAEMLSWPIDIPHVYMVDRWVCNPGQRGDGGFPQQWHDANLIAARAKVAHWGPRAVFLRGDSVEMAMRVPDSSLRLAYFDADHSYEGLKRDLEAWIFKVVAGGYMAFHDYQAPQYGVKRAVQEFCKAHGYEIFELPEDKEQDAGAYFRC